MKNLVKFLVPAAVAALALVSCNKEDNYTSPADANAVTIRVHANAEALKADDQETKTYIDANKTILWGTGEYMKLALTAGEATTFANSTDASADIFNGDTEAMFEFSVTPTAASEYVYQGLYPASAAATSTNTNAANYKVNLPAIQNATASSYDPAAYIMVAKPETFTSVQGDWEASFRRGTALNKITLKNFASSVEINKVKITAEGKKLAGGRHFNLTTGEGLEVYGTDATIEVLYATPLTGTSMDVWFTSWDAEIAEGEKLTIVAYTTDNKSYTKEITVPAGKTIKFQEQYLNTLGAKFDTVTPENVASLDGDYVILAKHNTSYYALKGEASTTRIASVDYSGSTSSYAGDASIIWTIATSGSGYTIKNGSNFIGWTSGNSADLVDENDYDATKCLMVIEEDGDVYHIKVSNDQSRVLAKNTGSDYFAFYASTGQYSDIVLVPATAMEKVETPTFSPVAGEVASGTEVTISTTTSGATIYYTTDGSVPTTSSTQGTSVTITAATTIKAIAVKEGMANSEVATAQYTIAGVTDYSVIETSNVTLTAGTNGSSASVNSEDAIKVGTSSKGGDMTVTVPAGTTKLHLHAAAWNGVNGLSLNISGATVSPTSIALTADSGIANNSPFTLAGNPADFYFVLELSDITADTEITFTSSIAKRFVVWGVNAEAGASVTWNLDSIAITTEPTKTTYTAGQSFDPAGMVVTGHFVDADNASNTKDEAVTGYTITPSGALSETDDHVTITYQGKSATQAITVNAAPAGNDGTLAHPYTATDVLGLTSATDVYVSGTIKSITEVSTSYHNATYVITDGNSDIIVFRGKFVNNTDFTSESQIKVNDEVVVFGNISQYNSVSQVSQGNYIVSLNGINKVLTAGSLTATPDNDNKQITVAWGAASGSNNTISYVITCGTQIQNATAAGSYTFTMADYGTYDVTVVASASDAISATVATSATLTDPNSTTKYYVKVSSTSDITNGDYLIVYESGSVAFNGGLTSFDAVGNTIGVTITSNGIEATSTVNAAKFTINSMTGGYSIMGASGKYITVNSYANGLATSTDAVANGISFDTSGNVLITIGLSGGTMTLKYNSASNQTRFRYYKSGQQSIQLYKLTN